jgi:molybdopterin synthase catalytic subunit
MNERLFAITDKPISVEEVIQKVMRPEAGAVATFIGTVREWTKGKRTLFLQYEAYVSMAEKMLAQIGAEIREK